MSTQIKMRLQSAIQLICPDLKRDYSEALHTVAVCRAVLLSHEAEVFQTPLGVDRIFVAAEITNVAIGCKQTDSLRSGDLSEDCPGTRSAKYQRVGVF